VCADADDKVVVVSRDVVCDSPDGIRVGVVDDKA